MLARASFGDWAQTLLRCCARWLPADGSAFRRGSAARPSALCWRRSWPAWKNFRLRRRGLLSYFWLINLAVILKGIEYIRVLQGISAPVLFGVGLLLLGVGLSRGGRLWSDVSVPSRFTSFPDFLKFLIPALNGTVGFWATVSLNIPDFTRFARNQREQIIGQALALPTTMTLYAFIGIAVTSATVVIYGTAIWDPVQLLSRFHSPVAVVISLIAILLATLNVNIGANVVSPANDFSNLWPRRISFRTGGVITCFMGIAMMPWKLLADYSTFIFGWLGGYAAFLGPVAGIMICDYFVIRRRVLRGGRFVSSRRNLRIFPRIQLACDDRAGVGAGTALAGLAVPSVRALYDYSWFVGFAVSFASYYVMMRFRTPQTALSAAQSGSQHDVLALVDCLRLSRNAGQDFALGNLRGFVLRRRTSDKY